MRLSNRNKAPIYNFINTLLWLLVLGGFGAYFLEKYKFHFLGWEKYLLIIIPIFLRILYYLMGKQIFEYDSDGEAINFRNRNVIPLFGKPIVDEFPKYKLEGYEVISVFPIKRLFITIYSKKGHSTKLKYDVSYLTANELKDLRISLSKVIKNNKERAKINKT